MNHDDKRKWQKCSVKQYAVALQIPAEVKRKKEQTWQRGREREKAREENRKSENRKFSHQHMTL